MLVEEGGEERPSVVDGFVGVFDLEETPVLGVR
jgi:hypothetical protein